MVHESGQVKGDFPDARFVLDENRSPGGSARTGNRRNAVAGKRWPGWKQRVFSPACASTCASITKGA